MKTPLFLMCRPRLGFPGLILLGFTTLLARGQGEISWPTNSFEPVVTIYASDSIGTESGPTPATFTVRRAGNTNNAVLVFYRLLGTASNGTDYAMPGETVNIPAGAVAARIEIAPIDDALIEGNETVAAQITPSPIVGPQPTYRIGWPSNAVVVIADNDAVVETNLAPRVAIVSPMDGAGFPAPGTIFIAAHATDFDGYVATVEFFAGTNSLGVTTNNPLSMSAINPFQITWSNIPPGSYTLRAKATDDDGLMTWSQPVHVFVGEENLQAVVNVFASDGTATEIPEVPPGQERPQLYDPALFTVTRTGNTNLDLPVYYRVSGSASNGVDYQELSGTVMIPAGAMAARIEISPIDDLLAEGKESVVITIEPPVCIAIYPPPPECYRVGLHGRAEAIIIDDDADKPTNNIPPSVRITAPPSGAIFRAPAAITIRALTVDPDGYANTVEFFANSNKIGEATVLFIREPDPGEPIEFEFLWQNVPTGDYVLTARTRDDDGAPATSAPVWIRVGDHCESDVVLWPHATGTIRFLPELGGQLDTPVGTDIQSAYFKTTEVNREFRRGFMEFAVPRFSSSVLRAKLVLAENRGWTSTPLPADLHELGFYPADLAVGTNDYARPVTLLDTFETDPNEAQRTFAFDITELLERFQGGNLGFRVKLAADPDYSTEGFLGTGFRTPQIVVSTCTNVPPPTPTNPVPRVTIVARDALAVEGTNSWWLSSSLLESWARWGVNRGGTNTATFIVSRTGETNEALTVYYSVGGTAENGVDYEGLTGGVTIPAGRRSARIEIIPRDDNLVEGLESVVIAVEPPPVLIPFWIGPITLPEPSYLPGFPSRAAALIQDNDRPRPPCLRLSDGQFHACLPATNGFCYRLEVSTNCVHWLPVCTNVVTEGALHFVDPDGPECQIRFYRAVPEPNWRPED